MSILKSQARASWTHNVDLIFLVSAPRSGTTWLQAMLSSHPEIYTGPETFFFETFAPVEKSIYHSGGELRVGLAEYFDKEEFYDLITELFWRIISILPEPPILLKYFLEKTASHCLCADFILKVFPNARFIHLIRDGRAVTASILRASRSWGKNWAPKTVDEAAKLWIKFVKASRDIAKMVRDPNQYIEVRYEDLRQNGAYELSRLLEWLNLSADESLLNTIVKKNSIENIRRSGYFQSIPIPKGSNAPTANVAYPKEFIGPAPFKVQDIGLNRFQYLQVEYLCSDLLHELGYRDMKR